MIWCIFIISNDIPGGVFSTSLAKPRPPREGLTCNAKLAVNEAAQCSGNPVAKPPCSARSFLGVIWKGAPLYIRQRGNGERQQKSQKQAPNPQGRRDIAQKQPCQQQKQLSTAQRLSKDWLMEAAGASSSSKDSLMQRLFACPLSISFSSPGSEFPNVFDTFPFLKTKLFTPAALHFIWSIGNISPEQAGITCLQ